MIIEVIIIYFKGIATLFQERITRKKYLLSNQLFISQFPIQISHKYFCGVTV